MKYELNLYHCVLQNISALYVIYTAYLHHPKCPLVESKVSIFQGETSFQSISEGLQTSPG